MPTLTLTREALALVSDLLDTNDDDEALADEYGYDLDTIAGLRRAVSDALTTGGE